MYTGKGKSVSLSKLSTLLPVIWLGFSALVGNSSSCYASFKEDKLENKAKSASSLDIPTTQQLEDLIKTDDVVKELRLEIEKPYGDITKLIKTFTDDKFREGAERGAKKNKKTLEDYRKEKAIPSFEGMKKIQRYVDTVSKNYPLLIICAKIALEKQRENQIPIKTINNNDFSPLIIEETKPVNSSQGHINLNLEISTNEEMIQSFRVELQRQQERIQELEQQLELKVTRKTVLNVQQVENTEEEQGNSSSANKSYLTMFWDWFCSCFSFESQSSEQQPLMAAKEVV